MRNGEGYYAMFRSNPNDEWVYQKFISHDDAYDFVIRHLAESENNQAYTFLAE